MVEQTKSSPDAIEAEIAVTRAHLATTIDELAVRAKPQEIARRRVASAKDSLRAATRTPEGELRMERVVAVAAASVALIGLLLALRRQHGHGSRG